MKEGMNERIIVPNQKKKKSKNQSPTLSAVQEELKTAVFVPKYKIHR